jgi:hypothetical protein
MPPFFEGKRGGGDEGDWLFEDLVIKVVLGLIIKFGLRVTSFLREERGSGGEFLHLNHPSFSFLSSTIQKL